MLKKIRLRIALLISMSCVLILTVMSLILLYSNYKQIYSNAMSDFTDKIIQLRYDISDPPILSIEKLRDYQNNNDLLIVVYENQNVTDFSRQTSSQDTMDFSDTLIHKYYSTAKDNLISGHINHSEFDAKRKINNYFCGIIIFSGNQSETEIVVISPLKKENLFFKSQIKNFLLLTALAFVIMFLFALILAQQLLKPVKRSHEQQNRFIAFASHEIRNPVNTIISALDAAEKGNAEEQKYFCNIAKKEGKRLSLLTEELLTLASSNNGSLVYNISDCELDSIIIDCYEAFFASAKKKNINFTIELSQEMVPKVKADPERIKQVINILLSNAVSFTKESGSITLSYFFDSEWHKIIVSDNGPGITDEEKNHIFEAFYRADYSRSGTSHFGLGLSIAKDIVVHHNGFIKVEDNKPCGTIFVVTLPIFTENEPKRSVI